MAPRTYDRMAPIYERLTDAYSLGCSPKAKQHQLTHIEPGMQVLYLGIGPGSEALGAAAKGAHVTGVDLSSKMIEIASERFSEEGFAGEFWAGDLLDYEPTRHFDAVVANFVLDCFDDEARPAVVRTMYDLTAPGGRALIVDTGRPRGSVAARATWYVYHGIAFTTTWLQGITPFLPVMDTPGDLADAGFTVTEHRLHRPWRRGPVLFEGIVAVRP